MRGSPQTSCRLDHLLGVAAGNEATCKICCAHASNFCQYRSQPPAACRSLKTLSRPSGHPRLRLTKVFRQVIRDGSVVGQHRQNIDKSKELNLQFLVAHRPVHQAIIPPTPLENPWAFSMHLGIEFLSDFDGTPLDRIPFRNGKIAGFNREIMNRAGRTQRTPSSLFRRDFSLASCI